MRLRSASICPRCRHRRYRHESVAEILTTPRLLRCPACGGDFKVIALGDGLPDDECDTASDCVPADERVALGSHEQETAWRLICSALNA